MARSWFRQWFLRGIISAGPRRRHPARLRLEVLEARTLLSFRPGAMLPVGSNPSAVAVADVNRDGLPDLIVPSPNESLVSVLLGQGGGTFGARRDVALSFAPLAVAVADIDRDGRPDLAVTSRSGAVGVMRGDGDGTFGTRLTHSFSGVPHSVAVADFNRDGLPDVAVTTSDQLLTFQGNGDFTFQPPRVYAFGTASTITAVAAADFNRDGIPDLAATYALGAAIFLGVGDGGFHPARTYDAGPTPWAVAVADFDRDGRPDLAVTNESSTVSILTTRADGGFFPPIPLAVAAQPRGVAAADLNGDGQPDLAVASPTGVSVAWGLGNGRFEAARPVATEASWSLAVADLDGDGKPDLAAIRNGSDARSHIDVLVNTTPLPVDLNRPIQYVRTDAAGYSPHAVAAADFDHDGLLDLAVANFALFTGSVTILRGNGDGSFSHAATLPAGNQAMSVAAADFNGDGKPDLAVTSRSGAVWVLLRSGGGFTFQEALPFGSGVNPVFVAVADVNRDGKPDLLVANEGATFFGNSLSVFLGNGDGTFQERRQFDAGSKPQTVAVADFNRDGQPDLAVTNDSGALTVLLGNGDGTFPAPRNIRVPFNQQSVTAADFNSDGKPDLAVTGRLSGRLLGVYLGNGDGTFGPLWTLDIAQNGWGLTAADLNADGKLDLVLGASADGTVQVAWGTGGRFHGPWPYSTGAGPSGPYGLAVADVNRDGRPDVISANYSNGTVGTLLGRRDSATRLDVQAPAFVVPGVPFTVTVRAAGAGGTTDSYFTDPVAFSSPTDGRFVPPAPYTYQLNDEGTRTFTLTLHTLGRQEVRVVDQRDGAIWGFVGLDVRTADAPHIFVTQGDLQRAVSDTAFALPLVATVTDTRLEPQAGVTVTFTILPGAYASGTFAGGGLTATAVTDAAGRATAPTLSATGGFGNFFVRAEPGGGAFAGFLLFVVPYAQVRGTVYVDTDGDGVRADGERTLAGRTVFLDRDGDGALSPGEPSAVTGADGTYLIGDVADGTYPLRLAFVPGEVPTLPLAAGDTLTATAGSDLAGRDFGVLPISTVVPVAAGLGFVAEPGTDAHAAVVDALYRSVLGRPADAEGLRLFAGRLAAGMPRAELARLLWESAEHRGLQADSYYRTFLRRPADAAGRAAWARALQAGLGEAEAVALFLGSPEYQARYAGDEGFVGGLYADVLGREAGAVDRAAWVAALRAGLRRDLVTEAFLRSAEADARALDSFYARYLHRVGDAEGRAVWLAPLRSGAVTLAEVAQAFLASNEFQAAATRTAT